MTEHFQIIRVSDADFGLESEPVQQTPLEIYEASAICPKKPTTCTRQNFIIWHRELPSKDHQQSGG